MAAEIIPEQKEGGKSDNVNSIKCIDEREAVYFFKRASNRLLDVNNWEKICNGLFKANFKLCDEFGNAINRLAQLNDYFKIDIPGPGTVAGEGYDWVEVVHISDVADKINNSQLLSITVKPASSPQNDKASIAHFFDEQATTTFLIRRHACSVSAEIHGRNEQPNDQVGNKIDTVRNTLVANAAMLGFSDTQWKQLVKAFLSESDPN